MPIKRRNYTFALTKDNKRVIKIVENYPKYAYICHNRDKGEVHYHYYVEFPNPRSLASVAGELSIPPNMIEQVYNKKGILEYLTHKNDLDKANYSEDEIITNMDFKREIQPEVDVMKECEDYFRFRDGEITWQEFLESHMSYCATLNYRNRIEIYKELYYNRNGGACPRSEFLVPQQRNRNKDGANGG